MVQLKFILIGNIMSQEKGVFMSDKNILDKELDNTNKIEESNSKKSEESIEELQSYNLILKNENSKIEDIFEPIIGQDKLLFELNHILQSFHNRKELIDNSIHVPKGFLMHTDKKLGKTFILEQIASNPFTNILFFTGSPSTIVKDLENTFEKASELDEAIILIDDIDALKDYDDAIDYIQSYMNFCMSQNMLIIATATKIEDIENLLLGPHFFEYHSEIEYSYDNIAKYVKKYVNYFHNKFDPNFELSYATDIFLGYFADYADINFIFNNAFYLSGNHLLTNRMFEKAYCVYINDYSIFEDVSMNKVIHEVGHYMVGKEVSNVFFDKELFNVFDIHISNYRNSEIRVGRIKNKTLFNQENSIMFALAGNLAEVLLLDKKKAWGASKDNLDALKIAQSIISYQGLHGAYDRVCDSDSFYHPDSEFKLRNLEKKEKKLIKKLERKTRFKIKHNRKRILALARIIKKRVLISGTELNRIDSELIDCKRKKDREEIIKKYINVI